MRNRLLHTMLVVGVLLSFPRPTAKAATPAETDGQVRVTLQLKQVSLRQAIKRISEETRAEIIFSDKLVRDLVVTADIEDLTVENALTAILATTALAFRKTEDQHYVLFRKPKENTRRRKIAGVVIDARTKKPLARANISLTGSQRGATTDRSGHFSLDALPTPTCTLRVSYIGYASQTVAIPAGRQTQKLHIKLVPVPLQTQAITVEHRSRAAIDMISDMGDPVAVYGRNPAMLPGAMGDDLLKTAEFLPGISSAKNAASGPFIRGGTPSQTLVLFAGIPIYNAAHSFGLLSAFSTDIMQELRLYKGVMPAKYGGRLSGIMELTPKSGDFSRFRVRSTTNLTGVSLLTEIPLGGMGSWLVSARRSYSGYMVHNLHDQIFNNEVEVNRQSFASTNSNPDREPLPSARYTESSPQSGFFDWIHRVTLTPTSNDYLTFTVFKSHDELVASRRISESQPIASDTLSPDLDFSGDQTKRETNSLGYSGKWARTWKERFLSTAQFVFSNYTSQYRRFHLYPGFSGAPSFDQRAFALEDASFGSDRALNRVREYIFNLDIEGRLGRSHALDIGVEFKRTSVRDSSELTSSGTVTGSENQETDALQMSFYAQDSWSVNDRLQTTGGFRLFSYSPTRQLFVEPRFHARYLLSEKLGLRAAWGRTTQVFSMIVNDFQNGNSNNPWVLAQDGDERGLAPGRAESYTVGGQYSSGPWMVDVEFYRKILSDLTEYRLAIVDEMANAGDPGFLRGSGISSGFDLLLQWHRPDFVGLMSYSFNNSLIRYPGYSGLGSFAADEDTPHTLRLSGNYTRGGWDFSFTWSFASGRPYTTPDFKAFFDGDNGLVLELATPVVRNDRRLPDNHSLDIRLSRSFSTKFIRGEWAISLLNVYDRRNSWYRYYIVSVGRRAPVDVRTLGFVPMVSAKLQLN